MESDTVFTVDLALLAIVAGTIVPILVGALTKLTAPSWVKAVLNAVLSVAGGLVATAIDGGGVFTEEALLAAAVTLVTSLALYAGFLKPVGITPVVQRATARFGIG